MNRWPLTVLLLTLAVLLGAGTLSQSLENADDLSVGDRFTLNIVGDFSINRVIVPDTLTNFVVLKSERVTKGTDKAWFKLTIVPLLPGSHSFPSLIVEPVLPDGQSYQTDRFRLNIIPVRAEADTLLRDIKPLQRYSLQLPLSAYLGLILLLALLIALILLLYRKRKVALEAETPVPAAEQKVPDPAWKTALQKLEELIAEGLIDRGDYILHHYRLSMLLREFLESKYRFSAVEMTVSEIRRALNRVKVEKDHELLRFLSYCDQVKFARHLPRPDEVEAAETWLRNWLKSFEVLDAQRLMSHGGKPDAALR